MLITILVGWLDPDILQLLVDLKGPGSLRKLASEFRLVDLILLGVEVIIFFFFSFRSMNYGLGIYIYIFRRHQSRIYILIFTFSSSFSQT